MSEATKLPSLMVFADDWGRHPSSCQHLVRRLVKDYRILWVNSIGTRQVRANALTLQRGIQKLGNWLQGLVKVSEQMWVLDLPMLPAMGSRALREINRILAAWRLKQVLRRLDMARPVVLTTLPYMAWLIHDLPRSALVYYCTDDYSHWPHADRETLQQADQDLSSKADLILAASRALATAHERTGRCEYFPHGVDVAHFARAQDAVPIPAAIERLPRPRIGYFGLIYEKLDFALLTALARSYPHGSLVMIGPVATCPASFKALANVHLLGAQPYQELPRFLAGLDVLLLPYVDDDMIRQSGPLKLRECLAAGKPTVSIDVPEVRRLEPHVYVAGNQAEFLERVKRALQEANSPTSVRDRQAAVAADTWEQRAALLSHYLMQRPASAIHPRFHLNGSVKALPRVLHLRVVSGKGGGPEKTILNSPRFLKDSYQLRLAYIRPAGDEAYDMPERASRLGVDLRDIPERGPADPRTVCALVQEIQEFRPDILHAHDYKTDFLAVLLGRWFHIPVVTTLHGFSVQGGRFAAYYKLDQWALRHMDHVIAVSTDLHRWLLEEMRLPPALCSQIDNAIDLEQYRRRRTQATAKEELGWRSDRLVIGSIGRLAPEKRFDLLIRSAAQLLKRGWPIDLVICGEGNERQQLEHLIADLGCALSVHLLGHRADPLHLYEAMDVFALASEREGLPNVLLEAAAMEVPIVATQVGGVSRIVRNNINGLLVQAHATDAFTSALERLLKDVGLRAQMGQAGRGIIADEFSFAMRMRKIRKIYDRVLGRGESSCCSR
ncbi:MAG TPA: glycosyltransferase [Gemmataceae bacterium]|nr:glycosyltransferase [Gemmataceae bacterium]